MFEGNDYPFVCPTTTCDSYYPTELFILWKNYGIILSHTEIAVNVSFAWRYLVQMYFVFIGVDCVGNEQQQLALDN